uniref:tax1-binding protein 1-like isoform X2 n=1 Tax=Ciona intestinalis TaxID=7719 RepID=UPI000EF4732B|nr:tax1-binding protein 1-like isoform X2 [Ciona intestinalis]|eukprot:XP_026693946.1 tax1-binding protein 1-like isoform X2 [Ciona intestinalis]
MGADAYKEKFVECHKLEKKVKKLKLIHKSTSSANVPLKTSTTTDGESTMQSNDGIMNKLEKLFLSIADPDAEEQEQTLKLQQKVDEMVKAVDTEHARYRKYKQLYIEEKQRSATKLAAATCKQDELQLRYEDEMERCKMLDDENMMLKTQLNEFIESSTDAAVRNVMTGTPQKERSDSNDDGLSYAGAAKAGFTNLCSKDIPTYSSEGKSDSDETSQPTTTRPVPISAPRKSKVISRQPIRSPPVLSDVVTSSSQSDSTTPSHTEARKKKGKNKKGKSRKSIRPIM